MDAVEYLSDLGVETDVIIIICDKLKTSRQGTTSSRIELDPGSVGLIMRAVSSGDDNIAIKDEDLPLLRDVIVSAAALFSGLPYITWAPVVIAELILTMYTIRKLGVRLSALQTCLARELRRKNGQLPTDLSINLSINIDVVIAELRLMQALRKPDGNLAEMFFEDAEGRWFSTGI